MHMYRRILPLLTVSYANFEIKNRAGTDLSSVSRLCALCPSVDRKSDAVSTLLT